jgi:hypothetical protein
MEQGAGEVRKCMGKGLISVASFQKPAANDQSFSTSIRQFLEPGILSFFLCEIKY